MAQHSSVRHAGQHHAYARKHGAAMQELKVLRTAISNRRDPHAVSVEEQKQISRKIETANESVRDGSFRSYNYGY